MRGGSFGRLVCDDPIFGIAKGLQKVWKIIIL